MARRARPVKHTAAHPGFKNVEARIAARQGVSMAEAGRELGARTRAASPAARKRNPRLNRVRGKAR